MSKHTAGSWERVDGRAARRSDEAPRTVLRQGARVVAVIESGARPADVALIAAAPDMADEIRAQIGWLKHARSECAGVVRESLLLGFDQSIKYLSAVLAKAEPRNA